jgi:hypothetical protein
MEYIMFFLIGLEIKASTLYWKALIACAVLEAVQISYKLYKTNGKGR